MSKKFFWPSAFCVDGKNIWFVYGKVPVICLYNMEEKRVQIMAGIPVDNIFKESLYIKIIKKGKKLYLIPCWANAVYVYDISKNTFKKILVSSGSGMLFVNAFLIGDEVICVPGAYRGIICIDTCSDMVELKCEISNIMEEKGIIYFNSADCCDGKILLASPQSCMGYVYDIQENSFYEMKICEKKCGYNSVVIQNHLSFWNSLEDRCIRILDADFSYLGELNWPDDSRGGYLYPWGNDKVLLDGYSGAMGWIYTANDIFGMYQSERLQDRDGYYTYCEGIYDRTNQMYFDNCAVAFFDLKKNCYFRIEISEEQINILKKIVAEAVSKKSDLILESYLYNLTNYLEEINL